MAIVGHEGTHERDMDSDSEDGSASKDSQDEESRVEDTIPPNHSYLNFVHAAWDPPDAPVQRSTLGSYYDPEEFVEDIAKDLPLE
ncbi:hypothetical protein QCA50_014823 [Cerrena zonata]|uniref:Uncharacterized protein n=1 Tax=Cerrena zonata TaxID=2478898 RepID=A0AAW0FNH6_9APHY